MAHVGSYKALTVLTSLDIPTLSIVNLYFSSHVLRMKLKACANFSQLGVVKPFIWKHFLVEKYPLTMFYKFEEKIHTEKGL